MTLQEIYKEDIRLNRADTWKAYDYAEWLSHHNIEIHFVKGEFQIFGFYKSSSVTLKDRAKGVIVEARYGELNGIRSLYDLIYLNYEWYEKSKGRTSVWTNPDPHWGELYIKAGIMKTVTETTTKWVKI